MRAHGDDRELPATRDLQRMKIAVAVPRIERFNGRRDQEIALSGVANSFAPRFMADALHLMQRVRHVIGERRLFENPLAIRLRESWKSDEQQDYEYFYFTIVHLSPLKITVRT